MSRCRFSDCAHRREPGCAVRDAIGRGELPAERYASYEKLKRELHRLEIRLDKRARGRGPAAARVLPGGPRPNESEPQALTDPQPRISETIDLATVCWTFAPALVVVVG